MRIMHESNNDAGDDDDASKKSSSRIAFVFPFDRFTKKEVALAYPTNSRHVEAPVDCSDSWQPSWHFCSAFIQTVS